MSCQLGIRGRVFIRRCRSRWLAFTHQIILKRQALLHIAQHFFASDGTLAKHVNASHHEYCGRAAVLLFGIL